MLCIDFFKLKCKWLFTVAAKNTFDCIKTELMNENCLSRRILRIFVTLKIWISATCFTTSFCVVASWWRNSFDGENLQVLLKLVKMLVTRCAQSCRRRNFTGEKHKVINSWTEVERVNEHFQRRSKRFPTIFEGKTFVLFLRAHLWFFRFSKYFHPSVFLMHLVWLWDFSEQQESPVSKIRVSSAQEVWMKNWLKRYFRIVT